MHRSYSHGGQSVFHHESTRDGRNQWAISRLPLRSLVSAALPIAHLDDGVARAMPATASHACPPHTRTIRTHWAGWMKKIYLLRTGNEEDSCHYASMSVCLSECSAEIGILGLQNRPSFICFAEGIRFSPLKPTPMFLWKVTPTCMK